MNDNESSERVERFNRYARSTPYFFIQWDCPELLKTRLTKGAGTYLEVGAGDGTKLQSMITDDLLTTYTQIIASDISVTRVNHIQQYVPAAQALLADAANLPIADQSIDFYFSDQVIEHVPDDAAMVAEVRRILKPGASGYIGSVLRLSGGWYFYRNNGKWRIDPTHVREYDSQDAYRALFTRAGLDVDHIEVTPISFPITDMVIRVLVRLGFLNADNVHGIYARRSFLRTLYKLRIPIPRYRTVGAYVRAPDSTTLRPTQLAP